MRYVICGDGGAGKDEFCKGMQMPFSSSSMFALDKFLWDKWGQHIYETKEDCFADRRNNRGRWLHEIKDYNRKDKTRLARELFGWYNVYCGMRDRTEFEACKERGMFDISIYIHRPNLAADVSNEIDSGMCDFIVVNDAGIAELHRKAFLLSSVDSPTLRGAGKDIQSMQQYIKDWADKVRPDRTVTEAFNKMVFEEIPEFFSSRDPMELGDIGILLLDIANLSGVDMGDVMLAKMAINEKRKWEIDSTTGLMKHKGDNNV